ncbi:hypothetical protein TI39_contig5875g00004 [Zymoseptoria brevis]|uniref:Uncharacterized protein n=1 Tax=Zymoseptoria brevis TaxID=1047168 RepID=A0A0F4G4N6_9PEZI|nr:hypothetical protein TI39_contig5875g00004 [Zymoseptoria brevis]
MAPANGERVEGKPVGRGGRPAFGRIVPAIPLALSKPRVPRQAKAESKAKGEQDAAGSVESAVNVKENGNGGGSQSSSVQAVQSVEEKTEQEEKDDAETQPAVPAPAVQLVVAEKSEEVEEANVVSIGSESAAVSVSDGPTPELSSNEADQSHSSPTSGHTEPVDSRVVENVSSPRKPTDRFDMRQIRTELPPAFVPSAGQYTPQSATSSQARSQPSFPPQHHQHPSHPSTSSIVFGGQDSLNSSPAPPMATNSAFPPPQPPQALFYGHAHHASEPPQGQRNFQPGYGARASQQFYHPQHAPFRYPQREGFAQGINSPQNGFVPNSRSGSPYSPQVPGSHRSASDLQSPVPTEPANSARHAQYNAKFAGKNQHRGLPTQHHYPPVPHNFNHETSSYESAEALRDYLMARYNSEELVDCILEISEANGNGDKEHVHSLHGHSVIFSRSPFLAKKITSEANRSIPDVPLQPDIYIGGQYHRLKPLLQAVRYLYGGSLPVLDFYTQGPNGTTVVPIIERMESALQHIATGAWLEVTPIAHRGMDIAFSLISWETVPSVLAFALDSGLGPMWPSDEPSTDREEPKYDPYASALLQRILEFMVHNFPPNFYIDAAAPQLAACPRLPTLPTPTSIPNSTHPTANSTTSKHESRPSTSSSDPRLCKIRFGDLSAEVPEPHARPSIAATNVSSILLSLPFPLLKFLLEHPALSDRLGAETVGSIMRQVVGEREVRRSKVLKAGRRQGVNGVGKVDVEGNLVWEEVVARSEVHRAGCCLGRRKVVGGQEGLTNGVEGGGEKSKERV